MICSNKFFLILLSLFAGIQLFAAPPVPFSGKLAVDGTNFHGNALFSFSIVDGEEQFTGSMPKMLTLLSKIL